MNNLSFTLMLVFGSLAIGSSLGALLHALETWNTRRRMKNAKIFRIKF